MTHYKTMIDTEYLGQWDIPAGRDVTVLIAKVERWTPEVQRSKKDPKDPTRRIHEPNKRIKISFQGKKKAWLAGPVSQSAIAAMYGPHVEHWIGKAITLYVDTQVKMGRATVGGLRVRPMVPTARPTDDPLDRPVDPEVRAAQDAAFERQPGED